MADGTPASESQASNKGSGAGGETSDPSSNPSAFLAPSDFLPRLPPSTDTPTLDPQHPEPEVAQSIGGATTAAATSTKPLVDAQGRTLNPRSCVTCRRRKVKCDKINPCTNCNRAHIECVFPAPGRAPRKARKIGDSRDKELLERLRRLEGVVKGMGVEVPSDGKESNVEHNGNKDNTDAEKGDGPPIGKPDAVAATCTQHADEVFRHKTAWVEEQQKGRFENRFGRLVVNEGKSRYINNSFWANLSNEVEDLKGILNQSSDDDEDNLTASPASNSQQAPSTHHAFVFGFSSQNADLLTLHPLPGQIREYWDIYKDRVDPLVKVLHIPSLEPTVLSAASHLANLSRGFECLLFTIYYAATTSLSAHDCLIKLGEEKAVLLARYRFAIEQALARANFLTTEELVVLQAFVVFLICLRRNSDARVIWTLTGLVVRIAQTIGIHRDGAHFGLSPFEVEMRRRLWWQVCILDTRASEDHGCDPTIIEQSFDTKMPLNINDVDITPSMKEFPPEQKGCTDMSFCLLRFEVANTFRRINYIPPGPPKACNEFYQSVTLEDKERWITECHKRLEERYLKHCDMTIPLFWVTATVARLMMSKLWLMVYHPFQRQDGGASLSEEVKEKLFITSLENMEYSLLLESEVRTMKWGWLFRTYIQWHALAFTLSELCHRTTGEMVERAWRAVDRTVDGRWSLNLQDETNVGHLWRPLKKLYRKAKDARARGLQEQQLVQQRNSNPPSRTYSPNANPMFGHPNRPRMTRAPLSAAQVQRFHQGPAFGQAPIDKHELLRSPRLSVASGEDPMETTGAGLNPDLLNQTLQSELDQSMANKQTTNQDILNEAGTFAFPAPNQAIAAPKAQNGMGPPMQFAPSFLGQPSNLDFSSMPLDATNGQIAQPTGSGDISDVPLRMDSMDSLDPSLDNIMDTSGDLNWENWDQLVRQFGMDFDSGTNGAAMNWNAPNWENSNGNYGGSSGANLRMGMGMGGGDWF
ncbi:hypothetical protein AC578_5631 [Pseudocercospora eumusae]|uniref:Zn(2)-C6 fungal-type domain-containing protein n=1 Tax=Pseudocercospora eumusae TaxID=321146 RepID=A0A139HT93_9PEZI|nr:hypothetical protein AC578_5631 [Pseudocercospora eumusae]